MPRARDRQEAAAGGLHRSARARSLTARQARWPALICRFLIARGRSRGLAGSTAAGTNRPNSNAPAPQPQLHLGPYHSIDPRAAPRLLPARMRDMTYEMRAALAAVDHG